MIRYTGISPTLRRFIGAHEAYRKAGFAADDIYCELAESLRAGGVLSCFALLRAQGKEFRIECGPTGDPDAFHAEHQRITQAVVDHEVSLEDLDRIWQESEAHQHAGLFIAALVDKGILPPGHPN